MSSDTILNNRYRLVAQQGSGGMAVIYKAIDQALGRTVAVKILRPSLTSDPAFLARFRNEARSVANLQHPNIVTVHDVGNDGSTHFIVMEFIEGQDLKKLIKATGALPVDRALNIAIQVCSGIGFAHRAGLVHADVKPQNVLVTNEDVVKVTDFGIAQALSDSQPGERQQVVWGSPHYFAPEQARGEKPSPAADVYSIGIVMFELLTGRLPYSGNNQQELALAHIRDRIPLVTEFNPNVPDNLVQIVYKVMSKEPAARYRMADQLGRILETYRDRGRQYTTQGAAVNASRPNAQTQPGQSAINFTPPPVQGPLMPSQPTQPNMSAVPPYTPPPSPSGYTPPPVSQPVNPYAPTNPMLPQGVEPMPPTQRMDLAPNAPQPNTYDRQPFPQQASPGGYTPPPQPMGQGGYGQPPMNQAYPQQNIPPLPPYEPQLDSQRMRSGQSGSYYPQDQRSDLPQALDLVTIILAVLAFFAVACLIPLYIAVFQARFGS
jgi:serine/threonine-protein kinase